MDYWIHDLDPILLSITESIAVRWYGLSYILGLFCGMRIILHWCKQHRAPLFASEVADLILYFGIGMVAGGRLGYCLFYQPSLFIEFGDGIPWWGVLRVNDGGMASHGGIIGMCVGIWLFCRSRKRHLLSMFDISAAVLPVGVFFGRIANFINGELWGRSTDVPWAVKFSDSICIPQGKYSNQVLVEHGVRVFSQNPMRPEYYNPDLIRYSDPWYAFVNTFAEARHPSQLYAAALEGLLLLGVSLYVHKRHNKPGLTVSTVLFTYTLVRFIGEFWREADAHIGYGFMHLSRGQLLSIPFMLAAAGMFWWAARRPAQTNLFLDPAQDPGPSQPNKPRKKQ